MKKNTETLIQRTPKTPKTHPDEVLGVLGGPQTRDLEKIPAFARLPALAGSAAARRANVSPDTIIRWCRQHAIGKQLGRKAPWRVDPLGLEIVMAGDAEALTLFRARELNHPSLATYGERLRRRD